MRECIRMARSEQLMGRGVSVPSRSRLRTLVADDFAPARSLLVDALSASGQFEVVAVAVDGLEALSAAGAEQLDLAVLDLAMPRAGALDVVDEICDLSPATRVVIVSGFPGRDLEELVTAGRACAYVRKRSSILAVVDDIVAAAGVLDLADGVLSDSRRFDRTLGAPRHARRFVEEVLARWHCQPALDTIHLLLSEVVANAVVHAGAEPEVAVRLLAERIRIEVSDDDATLPQSVDGGPMAVSGRGIRIVASEAADWGVAPRPRGGKTVWFEIPRFTT
jgi:CheY-like chemotaxis protein